MKKMMTGMMLAAAVTVLGASGVSADGVDKVDVQGIRFEIPEEIRDLVTVKTEGLEEGELVSVYETASIDATKAMGDDYEGAGWIFSIIRVPEDKMKELRCGELFGMMVFAEDDDIYYVYDHPTDVRLIRESDEEMQEAIEPWSEINEWANRTWICIWHRPRTGREQSSNSGRLTTVLIRWIRRPWMRMIISRILQRTSPMTICQMWKLRTENTMSCLLMYMVMK